VTIPVAEAPTGAHPTTSPSREVDAPFAPAAVRRAHAAARRFLGCSHLADDVVQDAMLTHWRRGEVLEHPAAWLLRATLLRCRQMRRSAARRRHHEHSAACALHRDCDNPLHSAIAHELGDRLDDALARLPVEQRQAFELYVDTGLDYAGIASAQALPIGTVRSRLHRARLALAGVLQAAPPDVTSV
jgi:RNA polymerase sigma-70 factor (ECF subfamily)